MLTIDIPCPICNQYVFGLEDNQDACEVCMWLNDGAQWRDPDLTVGPNELSINEYKIYYKLSLSPKNAQLKELRDQFQAKKTAIRSKYNVRTDGDKIRAEIHVARDEYAEQILALDKAP